MTSNHNNNKPGKSDNKNEGDDDSLTADNDLEEDFYSMFNVPKDVRKANSLKLGIIYLLIDRYIIIVLRQVIEI